MRKKIHVRFSVNKVKFKSHVSFEISEEQLKRIYYSHKQ